MRSVGAESDDTKGGGDALDDAGLIHQATALAAEILDAAHRLESGSARRRRRRLARLVGDERSRAFVQALTDQVPRIREPRRAAD